MQYFDISFMYFMFEFLNFKIIVKVEILHISYVCYARTTCSFDPLVVMRQLVPGIIISRGDTRL